MTRARSPPELQTGQGPRCWLPLGLSVKPRSSAACMMVMRDFSSTKSMYGMGISSRCAAAPHCTIREELHPGRRKDMSVVEGSAGSARQKAERRKPVYVVRAPDPNARGRWVTLGYAWQRKNGEEGFSVKL